MVLFSPTSRGWGGMEGAPWGARGLSWLLMHWEVPDVRLRRYLGSMPLSECSFLAWAPELPPPQEFPLTLSAQVDAQLTGRINQKAEKGTKVEMVGWGRRPWCPLCALHAVYMRPIPILFPPAPTPGQSLGYVGTSFEKEG